MLEQKRLENHDIYYIGATELPFRFPRCAPLLGQDFLPQDQQLKIIQLCLDKIWFDHSISLEILLNKPQLEFQNCQRFKIGNFSTGCNPEAKF